MESHGGRSLETPRGVAVAPTEQRATITTGSNNIQQLPLDVRECGGGGEDGIFYRIGSCGRGGGQVPPTAPRRPDVPVRVHTRPQMAIVTQPPPQTCVLQPITSSGPIRTTNLVRSSSRTASSSSSGLRRNISDFAPVTIPDRNNFSTISSSSSGRLENTAIPSTPVLNGRTQYSNSLTNSAGSRRTGSVNSSVVEPVSLTLPRPETERTSNEYVETPLRTGLSLIEPKLEPSPHRTIRTPSGITGGETIQRDSSNFAMVTLPVTNFNNKNGERSSQRHHHGEKKVITTQPSATFKKERIPSESQCSRQNDDFIICSECKKCRCESCRTPRPLPSTWLCGTCHCSADTVVDYTTCLCCAKAFFYHCCNDETVSYADEPCSCSPDGWYARFGCLSIMSIFLPCLFLYWPCRGLVNLCESCHQYASSQGCRCQKLQHQPAPLNFEKRLLDSPE